ncbi:MAG: hypothetical protein WB471_01655 [Nocardioides sp.]
MRPTTALVALILTLVVAVSGCSELEEAASDTANGAACSVAQKTVDGVSGQVDKAIDEIGADPAAAEQKLSGLRDVLETARSGISGEAKDKLDEAVGALNGLVEQAGRAVQGADVDTSAIGTAQEAFGEAVDGVRDVC